MTQQEKLGTFVHFLLIEVITCEFEMELHNWNIIFKVADTCTYFFAVRFIVFTIFKSNYYIIIYYYYIII
jgi:hypothetical protein